ncbi:MAG: DUF4922 domain-containing protein [Bacteroidota bacterium]
MTEARSLPEGLAGRLVTLPGNDVVSRMEALLRQQKDTWPRLRDGYAALGSVQERRLAFGDVTIRIVFNPARIVSTSAAVDDRSVRERKCFLCAANLPPEQRGFLYGGHHIVLCNPFPIFREHFTIPDVAHIPQRIDGMFGTMLDLARDASPRYMVMYNGPRSGASAPDHQHFQAGETGFLEIESEVEHLAGQGELLAQGEYLTATAVNDGLRRWIALEGRAKDRLASAFNNTVAALRNGGTPGEEPMMNILTWYLGDRWRVLIFPRTRHRPSVYFAEGDAKIMISPAGTDCGGVCITPLERDFHRLTPDTVRTIFDEIMMPPVTFSTVSARVRQALAADPSSRKPLQ